ncbi:MAG: ATP-binding cassette domain-containing protein, partial [Eubacterium sp.]
TLKDNILLPLVLQKMTYKQMIRRLSPLAQKLGISELLNKYPYEVSGGQKQRAAAARALITQPELLLADEPTGALDSHSSDVLMDLLSEVNREGQTILMVTHSTKAASYARRVMFIKDGQVFHQIFKGDRTNEEMFKVIAETQTVLMNGGDLNEQR